MNARETPKSALVGVLLLLTAVVACAVIGPKCCTDPDGAIRTLHAAGYTDIKLKGYRMFGGGNDVYVTEFEATAPSSQTVTGCVTRGVLGKGSTIRLD